MQRNATLILGVYSENSQITGVTCKLRSTDDLVELGFYQAATLWEALGDALADVRLVGAWRVEIYSNRALRLTQLGYEAGRSTAGRGQLRPDATKLKLWQTQYAATLSVQQLLFSYPGGVRQFVVSDAALKRTKEQMK